MNRITNQTQLEIRCLFIIIIAMVFILTYNFRQSIDPKTTTSSLVSLPVAPIFSQIYLKNMTDLEIHKVAFEPLPEYGECEIEEWNNVTTDRIEMNEKRREWANHRVGGMGNLADGQLRVISAFVYKKEIVVTTTAENYHGNTIYCRYFDCNRVEIPNSTYESFMHPMTSAFCLRRPGVKFVGLTKTRDEEAVDPAPVTFRAYDKPVHEIAVCVGAIYGNESRWLEIVETTEHHYLMGIRYFYHTIYNEMDSHTRKLLDEYQRLGYSEVTMVQTEYKVMDWMFHSIQIHECYFRARHHSKWVLNVDIDERLVMVQMPLRSYLQSIPEDVGEIAFATNKIQRNEKFPERYTGVSDLEKQVLFLNNNVTSELFYAGMKSIFRPDKNENMFYHWTWIQYPGVRVISASRYTGYIRHYRTTLPGLRRTWIRHHLKFRPNRLDADFEQKLWEAVKKRIERTYEQRDIYCEELPPTLFRTFTKDNYHCTWKGNGTVYGQE